MTWLFPILELLQRTFIQIFKNRMAPEFFMNEPVTLKADVYSFGCIMEEIFSGVPIHSDQNFRGKRDVELRRGYE